MDCHEDCHDDRHDDRQAPKRKEVPEPLPSPPETGKEDLPSPPCEPASSPPSRETEGDEAQGRPEDTAILIRKAKEGDRKAWADIYERYYALWCRRWHGQLGRDLRRGYETRDLVQSAMVEALRDIGDLTNEEAFFAWVNTIVHRKIIEKRRKAHGRHAVPLDEAKEPARTDTQIELPLTTEEDQRRLRQAIVRNFRNCPNQMKAVWLKYCEKVEMSELKEIFGMSERSTYRLLQEGLSILRAQLGKQ